METKEVKSKKSTSILDLDLKVKVRYISPVESWLKGVHNTANGSYIGTLISIGFPLDSTGEYPKTGLTAEEASQLEGLLYLKDGDISNPRSEFLNNFEYRFDKSKEQLLDLSVPLDKLKYICLMANEGRVVTDMKQKITKPMAEFLILNDETEALNSVSKFELKSKLYKAVDSLTALDFKNILLSLGERVSDLGDNQISAKVKNLAEEEPVMMLKLIEEVKSDPIKAEFNEMVHYQVLVYKSAYYVVNDEKADILGRNSEDCINFLKDPKNKDLTALLKTRLKEAKSKK